MAPPKKYRFTKGSAKAKAAGRKKPGSGKSKSMPKGLVSKFKKKG